MKDFFKKLLSGVNNDVSSKRFITLASFVLISIAFIANIFFDIPMREYVWNGMLIFCGSGLGFTTLEYFGKK